MRSRHLYKAFSLTEVLLAVGTLAIGMLFIAGTFMTGIYLTTIAAERSMAAVAADEAFAKIKLYGINPVDPDLAVNQLTVLQDVTARPIDPNEFAYPSTLVPFSEKQYYWSALCRQVDPNSASRLVQVTVLASRKAGRATSYRGGAGRPIPLPVSISGTLGSNVLTIGEPDKITWINDGYTIVDNQTGQIYRVLQRYAAQPNAIELDRPWQGGPLGLVWVVPPPIGGGKNPCIAVYQKVMRF